MNEVELLFAEDAPAPSYEVVDLGELVPGGPVSATATAINKRGNVVGWYYDTARSENRAVLWDLDFVGHEVAVELDTPCAGICLRRHAYALDVNDHDEVVGYRQTQGGQGPRAAHWRLRSARPLPGQQADSTSYAINNEGDVAGYEFQWLSTSPGSSYAYRLHWEAARNGALLDPAITSSNGNDVNDLGDVVGRFFDPSAQANRPFFYRAHNPNGQAGETLSLEQGYASGYATAVNNARLIAGVQTTAGGVNHATVWRHNGFIWLPARLDASASGVALGVNDLGHLVGHRDGTTAVLWRDGSAYDLNQHIPAADQAEWQLREARDINDRGEIVGIRTP